MTQQIVILGSGSVGKCCLYYLERVLGKHIPFDYNHVTVVDKNTKMFNFPTVQIAVSRGTTCIQFNIKRDNINILFDNILKLDKHDIVIDLTTNTPTYKLFKECRKRKLLYINTSIEDDKPLMYSDACPMSRGIFLQHLNMLSIADKMAHEKITSVIEFGMNPGLISIFVKRGILDMAKYVLKHKNDIVLKGLLKEKSYKQIAEYLKVRTIHCSEIDTQLPKSTDYKQFVNTWSCVGLITEGIESAEIVLGTHEKVLPFEESQVSQVLPQLLVTKQSGQDIKFQSIVPYLSTHDQIKFANITGRCIHHGEGISLNRLLSSMDYGPTIHYVYQLNPITDFQLDNCDKTDLVTVSQHDSWWKVLNVHDDELSGTDNIGALFILEENPLTNDKTKPFCYWTGSIMDTKYTKNTLDDNYFGPTVVQVMAGILGGVLWMIRNKNKGICFGEDLDENFILKHVEQYLGVYFSGPVVDCDLPGYTLDSLIVQGRSGTTRTKDL